MKSRSSTLANRSLNSVLAAIEIYNKPTFADREQVFSVLMMIGWETLLKARILAQNANKLASIGIKVGGRFKRNRTGKVMTVSSGEALKILKLDPIVEENIYRLTEVRDAAVHMTAQSEALPYLVYTLGAASLRNYCTLAEKWFKMNLSEFNFYILPLGFSYPFKSLKMAQISKEPSEILAIINLVTTAQDANLDHAGDFHLVCEIETHLVSAKKITSKTDITAAIGAAGAADVKIVTRKTNRLDDYPLSFQQLWEGIKTAVPGVKQTLAMNTIKTLGIKGNDKYSAYSYPTKSKESKGPTKTTTVIYNEDALKLLVETLKKDQK